MELKKTSNFNSSQQNWRNISLTFYIIIFRWSCRRLLVQQFGHHDRRGSPLLRLRQLLHQPHRHLAERQARQESLQLWILQGRGLGSFIHNHTGKKSSIFLSKRVIFKAYIELTVMLFKDRSFLWIYFHSHHTNRLKLAVEM